MARRKTLGLDADLVNEVRSVASRRGMSLASYLRKLLTAALELERRGLYAPRALEEKRVEHVLRSFGFVYVPADAMGGAADAELLRSVRGYCERLGATLRELGISVYEVVEFLSSSAGIAIHEGDKLIVAPPPGGRGLVAEAVRGLAVGGGLECGEGRGVFMVRVPPEVVREMAREVEEAGRRRARAARAR